MIAFEATKRGLTDRETTMEDTHVWVMKADGTGRRELGRSTTARGRPSGRPTVRRSCSPCRSAATCDCIARRSPVSAGGPACKPEVVVSERGTVGSFSMARNTIAYTLATPADQAELYIRVGTAAPRRVTDLNAAVLGGKRLADVESFTFVSNDSKFEVEAFLTRPIGLNDGAKYPLIVNIHGGPHGQQGPAFNFKNQVYAARGWAALMVNYRGSTGYGQAFADAVFADQNGNEGQDVLYGRQRRAAAVSVDRSRSPRRRGHELRRPALDVA